MKLFTNFHSPSELLDVVKLYFTDAEQTDDERDADIICRTDTSEEVFSVTAAFGRVKNQRTDVIPFKDKLHAVRLQKRYAKLCLYRCLSQATGIEMPWGSLTGIRPAKLAYQLISEGLDYEKVFTELLGVSENKTKLVKDILKSQEGLRVYRGNTADLYVGIPFCASRCSYCSFTSGEISKLQKYVEPYVEALRRDIRETLMFADERGISIKNVYIGGGTPTSLTVAQLSVIIGEILSFIAPSEFTVEAGRPDTLDADKLRLFADSGVGRVSVNPQTFNQSVLDAVGRRHTVEDTVEKTELAKSMGFIVNMDLIAGLPGESGEQFAYSADCAAGLSPQNVTVHTLALKRGSILKEQNYFERQSDVAAMVEYAHKKLYGSGYKPYYLYRQKYVTENLENVGFCKPGTACVYNIDIMEEISDILACGANAISKRIVSEENRIERAANAKDVITYIERTEDYITRKRALYGK